MGNACDSRHNSDSSEEVSSEEVNQTLIPTDDEHSEEEEEPYQPGPLARCCCPSGGMTRLKTKADMYSTRGLAKSHTAKMLVRKTKGKKIDQEFIIQGAEVGSGGFAEVKKGIDRKTKEERAIKIMSKRRIGNESRLQEEIEMMESMDHPNVIKLFQVFEDAKFLYLIMEICDGKELFDYIENVHHYHKYDFSEGTCATIMKQIFKAVHYMHESGVVHRDLKPENFLLLRNTDSVPIEQNMIKTIDFGLAASFVPGDVDTAVFTQKVGTPCYVAPEVLSGSTWSGKYGPKVDLWSAGVTMYAVLSGSLPFVGHPAEIQRKVKQGTYRFPDKRWADKSKESVKLIKRLMEVDAKARMNANQALNDPWLTGKASAAPLQRLTDIHIKNMRSFRDANKFKKAAMQVVARHLQDSELKELRTIFEDMDIDGNGVLTTQEFKEGLQTADPRVAAELDGILSAIDDNDSGAIDYTEFLAASLAKRDYNEDAVCWSAFRVFDTDGDMRISQQELATALNANKSEIESKLGEDAIRKIMAQNDLNGDGYIDYEEFKQMLRQ